MAKKMPSNDDVDFVATLGVKRGHVATGRDIDPLYISIIFGR